MAKLTLDDLRKLRATKRHDFLKRFGEGKAQIIVGMGTCGIAKGAKKTVDAFLAAVDENKLVESVVVRQVGCMGMCKSEPTVEVRATRRKVYKETREKIAQWRRK